ALSHDGRWLAARFDPGAEPSWWRRWLGNLISLPTGPQAFVVRTFALNRWWSNDLEVPGGQRAAFAPDGRTLAVVDSSGQVQLWDFPARTPWALVLGSGALAAAAAYGLPALWRGRRRRKEGTP